LIDAPLSIGNFVIIDNYHPEIRAIMSESTSEYNGIHKVWTAGIEGLQPNYPAAPADLTVK